MRCCWAEGLRHSLRTCDAPRVAGPFCGPHAVRGLARRRIEAGLDPYHVDPALWPLDERPGARPKVVISAQASHHASSLRGIAKGARRQQDDADARNAVLRQHVEAVIAEGSTSARRIAEALNARAVPRPAQARGKAWDVSAVGLLLARLSIRLSTYNRTPHQRQGGLAQAA